MDRQSEVTKVRNGKFKLPRYRQPVTRLATTFVILLSVAPDNARRPRYPELNVIRDTTPESNCMRSVPVDSLFVELGPLRFSKRREDL